MTATQRVIDTPGAAIPTIQAGNPDESRGAVLVLHQAAGLSDQTSSTVSRLADLGYWAVAPDLFHRKAGETIPFPTGPEGFEAFDRWLSGDEQLRSDIAAVLDHIRSLGYADKSIAVVGYSYGGRASYLTATQWRLGAAVSYYGNGIHHRSFAGNPDLLPLSENPLQTPWLGLYGDQDFLIPADELDGLADVVNSSDVHAQLVRYPTAGHGFDVDDPRSPVPFDAAVAEDAWVRLIGFLEAYVADREVAIRPDDRAELIERVRIQDHIDDPTVGFTDAGGFEGGSLVWPDERWLEVTIDHRHSNDRRDVWECTYVRAEDTPNRVPVAFVWDKTNEDARARVYYNKAHFGLTEPRRPLIAPEEVPLPDELSAYVRAIRAGDRELLESIIHPDAVFHSPVGIVTAQQFIDGFSAEPAVGVKGVPLQPCTFTGENGTYAIEFISWRRPPHGGLGTYVFEEGRLRSMRVFEGPVYR